MRLDAGGIGMGYGVDEAFKILKKEGITSALIDASGDIGVSDPPPGTPGWRIGIEPPSGDGPPSRYVVLSNYAITTSGDAFQAVEIDGKRFSHVIDPRTGLGVIGHSSVTVIAPDCITADSYTKPICVLAPTLASKLSKPHQARLHSWNAKSKTPINQKKRRRCKQNDSGSF